MSNIQVNRDSKLIKVLAAQARSERVDGSHIDEAAAIVKELSSDMSPQARHQLAQTIAYSVDELQSQDLDFLNQIADVKNIGYGDKAAFHVKAGTIHAYVQAKGATTARSMVADRQFLVGTKEVSARPAINIVDLRLGRVNMPDLIAEANREMTNMKIREVETVLHAAIDDYAAPFYATGTGVVKNTLDAQIAFFRRLGPVTILGDIAAVGQLAGLAGMAMQADGTFMQRTDTMIDNANDNGFIGRYNGCNVVCLNNGYVPGTTTPVLNPDWLYLIPGGVSTEARNLKIVNEGSVNAFESQNIDDLVYEVRLDQWFGVAFCAGNYPTIGAYSIN